RRGGRPELHSDIPPSAPLPQEERSAQWGDVLQSLPAQAVATTRAALANLRRMGAEESILEREDALRQAVAHPARLAGLGKERAGDRQRVRLEADRAELAEAVADAAQARRDTQLVTPPDQTITQEALSSLAQSAGPTLLGIAAVILTRNLPVALSIAGGGG